MGKNTAIIDASGLSHAEKNEVIGMLQEQILLLKEKINRLAAKIKVLEGRSKKNSKNSHKPPSTDEKSRNKKTTSSREKSSNNPGGQPGHPGKTLEQHKNPDEIVKLTVSDCAHCGTSLRNTATSIIRRQQFEIPPIHMFVTEYQAESKDCKCGYNTTACFPEGITNTVQYGPNARALMVYLNQYQFIPYLRIKQLFKDVFGKDISPGTIVNAINSLSANLNILDSQIKNKLRRSTVIHCDETGMNVNGEKQWLHTSGNEKWAHFGLHAKRGQQASQEINILPRSKGIMVHDHWKSYFRYSRNEHALCNAHHIRELRFIHENHSMQWAKNMKGLLLEINQSKDKYVNQNKTKFSKWLLRKYNSAYDSILVLAEREQRVRGTIDSRNLINRLKGYKKETLLFMNNFKVPFTNNLAERDIRMAKVKQKISGYFRSKISSNSFCKIRTMIISATKNRKNIFKTIQAAFRGTMTTKLLLCEDLAVVVSTRLCK